MADKLHRPFGPLEQRELKYLYAIGAPPMWRYLLVVLRVRLDPKTGSVAYGRKSLSDWSGMSQRSLPRGLAWLESRGLIRRTRRRSGESWLHSVRPLAYDEWPNERAKLAPPPMEASAPKRAIERAKSAFEGAKASDIVQMSSPDASSREVASPLKRTGENARADGFVEAQSASWRAVRDEQGLTRFVDGVALGWLEDAVRHLQLDGYSDAEIERAVTDHVAEPFADPRELPRWAKTARDEREYLEREVLRLEVKRREEAEHDALVERERLARVAAGLPAVSKLSLANLSMDRDSS